MKIERIRKNDVINVIFIAENLDEQYILATLRNHFFYGIDNDKTFPEYDGCESEGNYVTKIKLKMNMFKK